MADIWTTIAAERGALADDLATLPADRWETSSLCAGWRVRDVVAHLCATASLNPARFFLGMAAAGFSFDRFTNGQLAKHLGPIRPPPSTNSAACSTRRRRHRPQGVVAGRDRVAWRRHPPAAGHPAYLLAGALRQTIDFYRGSNLLSGAKKRISGLQLCATDDDWRHGQGERVEGPLLSLLLAMTGRAAGCVDLTGPGAQLLRSRCSGT
ncbi:hypothetical protein I551_1071 [Mycobacterium ulcerans str. Harvey]|uniref:Mycothiol-dependent maleylpyruvate isomerase metal-binding domain-containing protein n=1 Tax=Mycobacterium ulcerans str. Harvey TaxID=1299332 RepID=A0ABN0R5F7_MYCUL|nr:hypothetical protein I551_1071 [Mycobacterium ulcerans str. Harvey]